MLSQYRVSIKINTRLFSTTLRNNIKGFNFPPTGTTNVNIFEALKDSDKQKTNDESAHGSASSQNIKTLEPKLIKSFQYSTIYDPFDFSMAKINLDRKHKSKFKLFGNNINPLDLYTSPEILSQYMTSTGKILHSDVTGLSAKNQRRLAKAIRRAQAIGLLSKTHN
ncbi:similar to Saccharomyces cerevisiae YER050C RSM18 Mitochondrial ribosomal protein of the small subunit, has similarity to E. coli S18 ribosomal protein [Maudiozyma barnettii]|uniref:Small ribosomal subunit protein bS18m n=1 Tax=Maudiozyma barnettii TaxID=61262 RepID=A0A8H2ZGT8_9SACH|nr:mitochondrial 37S ribosomal protein RSM18 [Kazachstania barnettii]CAB4254033.1 similar to Saccharomyces cerevisiae YER050C RSM18 Mitochondrial ribosomal protein of the small subunit, has similarity to E. coli S18 ribosomal protein [Kazachstania barnettii]CAD1781783.1 similar to Saccharomyces cerevisiae YER050C RSM18 Mitochondrial ribosomal protein of the small subunit, has similarity to E. coli S18 ribosomal protein [Kazachstania barnettii]